MKTYKRIVASLTAFVVLMTCVTMFNASAADVKLLGDADLDSSVDIKDVTAISKYISSADSNVIDLDSADVDSSEEVDVTDASLIQRCLSGFDVPYKIGEPMEEIITYSLDNIRDYVVGIDEPMELSDGTSKAVINFDNAATTPVLQPVMDEVNEMMAKYGSIGRGFSPKSNYSTDIYNNTREKVLNFLNANNGDYTCVYVNNTTDGLNKLAGALIESKDQTVLATRMEHHANDLSWRERCNMLYAETDKNGRIIYDDIEKYLKNNKVDYVTVTAASNVTGYITDVHRVARMAHQYGAKIIVDGAQIVAHRKFSMLGDTPEENIDFFVFSAHKMYSPYGGGAIVGLTDELNKHMPEFYGGGTIKIVGDDWAKYKDAPALYEAGSPNYPGVVGMGKAIDILTEIGFDAIEAHEKELNQRLVDGLKKIDNYIIYGDSEDLSDRVGVITFNFSDQNSYLVAKSLSDDFGIATRRGAFCANTYVWRLYGYDDEYIKERYSQCADINTPGMIRVSYGLYNTPEEVDYLLSVLPQAKINAEKAMMDPNNNYGNVHISS